MNNKVMMPETEFGNCKICNNEVNINNLGGEIAPGIACKSCYNKFIKNIVNRLEKLRISQNFDNRLVLSREFFRVNDEMGDWMESYDTISVNETSLESIQMILLEIQVDLMKELEIDSSSVKRQIKEIYSRWERLGGMSREFGGKYG